MRMSPSPQGVVAVAVILPVFSMIAVIARFHVRKIKSTKLGSDDWSMLIAMVSQSRI